MEITFGCSIMTSHTIAFIHRMVLVLSLTVGVSECKPVQVLIGGVISDGLDLSNVRIGEHAGYTRIVFDVQYWEHHGDGTGVTPSDTPGYYRFTLEKNHTIEARLSGFRSRSADVTLSEYSKRVQSIEVLGGQAYADDSAIFYKIHLRGPVILKAFHLYNPARIVLDISSPPL